MHMRANQVAFSHCRMTMPANTQNERRWQRNEKAFLFIACLTYNGQLAFASRAAVEMHGKSCIYVVIAAFLLTRQRFCGGETVMNDITIASALMGDLPISMTEAVRLVLEMVEESGCAGLDATGVMSRCRRMLRLGAEALRQEGSTVSFNYAVGETLRAKDHRSARTRQDIRYFHRRMMRAAPELAERPLRTLNAADCSRILDKAYPTASQRRKARAIMSSIFSTCRRRGWCGENPVAMVDVPHIKEREIRPLDIAQVRRLVRTACEPRHRVCLPALALMLYAGVRPKEVQRLTWGNIDWEEQEIMIPPRHSKTGGGRYIAIQPVLRGLLEQFPHSPGQRICPPNWRFRWRNLRREAGFEVWTQDVLRHTFASYYAKHYRDINALQLYMGHRNLQLLYTRYINMRGIDRASAALFWEGEFEVGEETE